MRLPCICLLLSIGCGVIDKYFDGIISLNSVIGVKVNVPREGELAGIEPVEMTSVTGCAPQRA